MIFADSSFFIGLADKRDSWHKRALKVKGRLRDELVISDLIISESVTMVGYRAGGDAGKTLFNFFKDNCMILYVDDDTLEEAVKLFSKFDGNLSVADSTSVIIMKRKKIKGIISFDSDFDKIKGINRIY
jgi:predicted nucleic acid-binding protein